MTVWAGVLVDVRLLCGKDGGDDAYQGDDDAAADAQSDIQKAVELCLYSVEALHHGFLICLKPAEDAPDIWLVREFDLWLSGRLCRQLVRSGWVGVGVRGLVVGFRWLLRLGFRAVVAGDGWEAVGACLLEWFVFYLLRVSCRSGCIEVGVGGRRGW